MLSRCLWLLTILTLCVARNAAAQQPAPAEITDEAWGIRFAPPPGWMQHPAQEGYLFASPMQDALLAVLPHDARTLDALRAEAQKGLADGMGTALQLQGSLEPFGDHGLAANFNGLIEGSPGQARVIGLLAPQGQGMTILVVTTPQLFSEAHKTIAEETARSVVFTALPAQTTSAQAAVQGGAEEQEWHDFLQGCRLSYFNSYNSGYGGGGYSDETVMDLCPGYFTFSDHSETVFNTMDPVSGSDPYLHSDRRGAGQWSIVRQGGQSVLQLRFHDGTVRSHSLGYDDGKTFLDGRRWLRTCNHNDSVVEARPQCQ